VIADRDWFVDRWRSGFDASRQTRYRCIVVRMVKEDDREPAGATLGRLGRVSHAMNGREPTIVGPSRHKIALVNHEGICNHRCVVPVAVRIGDLKTTNRIAWLEDRDGPIIRMGSGAELAGQRRNSLLRVKAHIEAADVTVNLIVEVNLGKTESECR